MRFYEFYEKKCEDIPELPAAKRQLFDLLLMQLLLMQLSFIFPTHTLILTE